LLMFCWLALNFEPPYLCLPSSWITGEPPCLAPFIISSSWNLSKFFQLFEIYPVI
jgi:hypothetical protein